MEKVQNIMTKNKKWELGSWLKGISVDEEERYYNILSLD